MKHAADENLTHKKTKLQFYRGWFENSMRLYKTDINLERVNNKKAKTLPENICNYTKNRCMLCPSWNETKIQIRVVIKFEPTMKEQEHNCQLSPFTGSSHWNTVMSREYTAGSIEDRVQPVADVWIYVDDVEWACRSYLASRLFTSFWQFSSCNARTTHHSGIHVEP